VAADRGPKQPYFLHPPERAVLAMAGIWSVWKDPSLTAMTGRGTRVKART
jgi:putative SOS response-associated peptidase YedK